MWGTLAIQLPVQEMLSWCTAPACSGAVAAAQRKQRAAAAEDARKVEALERRQRAMDRWRLTSPVAAAPHTVHRVFLAPLKPLLQIPGTHWPRGMSHTPVL